MAQVFIAQNYLLFQNVVPMQMKTRIVCANQGKGHLPGIIVASTGSENLQNIYMNQNEMFCITIIELVSEFLNDITQFLIRKFTLI